MAVSSAVYKVIRKACQVRIESGEDAQEVIESYNKLSDEQVELLKAELIEAGYME